MTIELITVLSGLVLGVLGYVFGFFTDRNKDKKDTYEKTIDFLKEQIIILNQRIGELERKIESDKLAYLNKIEALQEENKRLSIELTRMKITCQGCHKNTLQNALEGQ
jgi:hypothetical protein